MNILRSLGYSIGAALPLVALSMSCSSSRDHFGDASPKLLPSSDAGDEAPPACQGLQCSPDLRQVLDGCTGEVLTECPPDQGCGNGACVPACDAAKASQGSTGCDFYTLPPDDDNPGTSPGSCFATILANTWDEPVTLSAEYGGKPLDISGSTYVGSAGQPSPFTLLAPLYGPLPPGQVAVVLLSSLLGPGEYASGGGVTMQGCPGKAALSTDPIAHGTTLTTAFRITTDRPVSAYSMYPFGHAQSRITSATLLRPVSSWTTNYIAINPWPGTSGESDPIVGGGASPPTNPFIQIVAAEEATEVRIRSTVTINAGYGIDEVLPGQVHSWTLSKGEVLQINQFEELTGSAIESDKPIGLFGGHECLFLPDKTAGFCDILHQQIPPLAQWGNEYALVPSISRGVAPELVPYRIVAAVDGTVFSYDAVDGPPADAPHTLDAGQSATFSSRSPMIVRSQDNTHPFYAAVYMTGARFQMSGGPNFEGDPDFVNAIASKQYLDRYLFYMDYTYANSSITVVRRKGKNGFAPVEIDCAGMLDGFLPLDTAGEYEYVQVPFTRGFKGQTFAKGTCGVGQHEAKSTEPFALYVWGTDTRASYGYPGGTGLRPISPITVEVPR